MIELIDLGSTLLQAFLTKTKSNLPTEVVQAVQAAIDALAAHKDDLITQANLEAQRS